MAEVLSQAQIDALLNSMNGGGGDSSPKKEEAPEKVRLLQSPEVYKRQAENAQRHF